jgi:cytochrome oxidase assembly protein ShyY1
MNHLRRGTVIVLIVLLAVALGCIRLGFWQLAHLEQRMTRSQSIRDQLNTNAITFSGEGPEFQCVIDDAVFLSHTRDRPESEV